MAKIIKLTRKIIGLTIVAKNFCQLGGVALLFISSHLLAHPHSWVDVKTTIQGNKTQILGFKMEWTFDEMTSVYMLDGKSPSAEQASAQYKELARSVINNMLNYHYFTYFYNGEQPIKYREAIQEDFRQERGKLILSFELPLARPQGLTGESLELKIFDPSYYVDISWKESKSIALSPELQAVCQLELIEPKPTSEQMAYAMSLGADEEADDSLGQLFTQTLSLSCGGNSAETSNAN